MLLLKQMTRSNDGIKVVATTTTMTKTAERRMVSSSSLPFLLPRLQRERKEDRCMMMMMMLSKSRKRRSTQKMTTLRNKRRTILRAPVLAVSVWPSVRVGPRVHHVAAESVVGQLAFRRHADERIGQNTSTSSWPLVSGEVITT